LSNSREQHFYFYSSTKILSYFFFFPNKSYFVAVLRTNVAMSAATNLKRWSFEGQMVMHARFNTAV